MTQEEIETGNKLIAEFMDISHTPNYHLHWDSIMPVVEKIESDGKFEFTIKNNHVRIYNWNGLYSYSDNSCKTKIEAVWKACIEFIKWQNQNK